MATAAAQVDTFLAPISAEAPSGERLSESDLNAIEAARRLDDGGGGVWAHERVEPNWERVRDLTSEAIATKCKSLQLATWFTQASTHVDGISGFTRGLDLIASLMRNFWNAGLFPRSEDDIREVRAANVASLNALIPPILRQVPITGRPSGGNYNLGQFDQSRRAGYEKDLRDENGNPNVKRQQERKEIVDAGGITGEMWDLAVKGTRRRFYEELSKELGRAWSSYNDLTTLMEDEAYLGTETPSLKDIRDILRELREVVDDILPTKRKEEPDVPPPVMDKAELQPPVASTVSSAPQRSPAGAERTEQWPQSGSRLGFLLETGQLEAAIEEMTSLAAGESSRARFLRKLEFAEICAQTNRLPLAAIVFEELDAEIKRLNLSSWESAELIARVWGGLYRLYRGTEDKQARASELYLSLCRLDPWQGLKWTVQ
jgi:type VI secretion system ImpA family protein